MLRPHVCSLFLAAALGAQASITPRSEGATVTFSIDGPSRFAEKMAKTKVAQMLRGKEFAELWAPLQKKLDEALAENKDEMPIDPKLLLERLTAYSGRVHGACWVQTGGEQTESWGYVIADGDGTTDLAQMCKELEKAALDAEEHKPRPMQLGGGEWLVGGDDEMWVSLPKMVGEQVVMLFGSPGKDGELAKLFEADAAAAKPDADNRPALHVNLDATALIDLLAEEADNEGLPFDFKELLQAMIGDGLGRIDLRVTAEGQYVDMTFDVETKGNPAGLLAMLYPQRQKPPAMLDLVPRQAPTFNAMPLVSSEFLPMLKRILELVPDAESWDDVEAMAEQQIGVRISSDVLAHFGDELLWIGAPPAASNPDEDEDELGAMSMVTAAIDGFSLGLGLRDGAALNRSLETILDRGGILRMRKTEKYRDVDVHRIALPMVDMKVYWAITDKLMFLGVGEVGLKNLQAVLDEAAARARGEAPGPFPPNITQRMQVLAEGYSSVSVTNIGWIIESTWTEFANEVGGDLDEVVDPDEAAKVRDKVKTMLRNAGLDTALAVQYVKPGRVIGRTIW